ncbi:39s ribosomal protein [Lynx pardinus]|uniref:Large ribosomal subunit protein bL20m n=1 Tax=Lynx pardinus TaxID=191816 RepID=A0A485NHB5_LYNPA|nr:39s ribosomal protein [Lynx pardinus]
MASPTSPHPRRLCQVYSRRPVFSPGKRDCRQPLTTRPLRRLRSYMRPRSRHARCSVDWLALWINRITAASQEHGLKYPAFIVNLIKCQVELNRKVLADLAIYEPKTFKSLAALAKRRRQEGFAAALGDGKEPEGVFSRVVQDC